MKFKFTGIYEAKGFIDSIMYDYARNKEQGVDCDAYISNVIVEVESKGLSPNYLTDEAECFGGVEE